MVIRRFLSFDYVVTDFSNLLSLCLDTMKKSILKESKTKSIQWRIFLCKSVRGVSVANLPTSVK